MAQTGSRDPSRESHPVPDAPHRVHETVLSLLDGVKPGRLLDVPAGEGALASQARLRGYEVSCGDIVPARFKVQDLPCQYVDLNERWPYRSEAFDYVVCIEAVEHVESPWHMIREANRVLSEGGVLFLTTPNVLSIKSRLSYLFYGYPNYFHYMIEQDETSQTELPIDHINPVTFLELRHVLARNGFRIERIETNQLLKRRSVLYRVLKTLMHSRGRSHARHNSAKAAVRRTLLSDPLLFGENLIIQARKISPVRSAS
jgi:2-polyprenyl-3-methyl-5-hydroxy-6-metoxy-1,4-benzoquinol methylase